MSPAFQEQFKLIRQTFVNGLSGRLQAIALAAREPLPADGKSPDPHANLQMELHRLAGAAGGYGFDELSALARQAMAAADAGAAEPLQQALQQLSDAAKAATAGMR